jgi:hypothetical protein
VTEKTDTSGDLRSIPPRMVRYRSGWIRPSKVISNAISAGFQSDYPRCLSAARGFLLNSAKGHLCGAVDAGRGVDERYARRAGPAAPAEPQHQWTMRGDTPGTYGE